jgi:hypothetical protein
MKPVEEYLVSICNQMAKMRQAQSGRKKSSTLKQSEAGISSIKKETKKNSW